MIISPLQIFTFRVLGTLAASQFGPDAKRYFDLLASAAQSNLNVEAYMKDVEAAMIAGTPIDWKSAHDELKAEHERLQS